MSKYKLTDEYIEYAGRKLYRIQAIVDVGKMRSGEKGAHVEEISNIEDAGGEIYGGVIYGGARISGDARISGGVISGGARISGGVISGGVIYGGARISGGVISGGVIYGDARISSQMHIRFGRLNIPVETFKEIEYIAASLNHYPVNGEFTLYKRVNKVSDGVYTSCYDSAFVYKTGETASVDEASTDIKASCSTGIHASRADYWNEGDTLIALKVKLSDIITCLEGKVRAKRVFVIGECYSERPV